MIFSFLLKGNFAHFKHHLSFKSRTTYLAPLKTELIGILLNVIGKYRKYTDIIKDYLNQIETGIYIKKIGGTIFDSVNLRKMPKSLSKIDRIRSFYKIEILFDVEYLVFYKINDEKLSESLKEVLEEGYRGVPYLGISDFLADLIPIDIEVREAFSDEIHNSYIQEHLIKDLSPEKGAIIRNQRVNIGSLERVVFFYNAKADLEDKIRIFEFEFDNHVRRVPIF